MMKKNALQKYWPLYLLTTGIAFMLRCFSKITDSDVILWMLTPTVRWVSILSGISFEYLPHRGYVSYFYRFLVAPSCAGIRFMMIAFLMQSFSFLYRIEKRRNGYLWFGFCVVFSYIATIFVNGIRIIASIYLPLLLERPGMADGFMTSDRQHTLIGTGVYFSSLCFLYLLSAFICKKWFQDTAKPASRAAVPACDFRPRRMFVPAFWYLLTVIGLPFCKRILTKDWEGFWPYAMLVIFTCLPVCALLYAADRLRYRISGDEGTGGTAR